jgi:hypothetical protein
MAEEFICIDCGKDITKESKYRTYGISGWKCKKCYFKPVKVDDRDLKDFNKVIFN